MYALKCANCGEIFGAGDLIQAVDEENENGKYSNQRCCPVCSMTEFEVYSISDLKSYTVPKNRETFDGYTHTTCRTEPEHLFTEECGFCNLEVGPILEKMFPVEHKSYTTDEIKNILANGKKNIEDMNFNTENVFY